MLPLSQIFNPAQAPAIHRVCSIQRCPASIAVIWKEYQMMGAGTAIATGSSHLMT